MKTQVLQLGLVGALVVMSSPSLLGNGNVTEPLGGQNISADKALNSTNGAAFTALGNIVISEGAGNDFAAGNGQTLILTIPPGWRFNAGVGSVTFQSSRDITSASISVAASNITVTFSVGTGTKSDVLTISGLQVQPLDGANAPLAGYIVRAWDNPGTANIAGIVPELTSFGLCNTVAGAARGLQMHTQPPVTAIAGTLFDPQPEVRVVDQFGNHRELDVTTLVTASRGAGTGTLQGSLTDVAVAGVVSYTNLSHNVPGTITLQFSGAGLTPVTSSNLVILPAPATRLAFSTQPGSASVGNPFGIQPVVKTLDQFGNNTAVGLPASKLVTVSLSSGTGPLLGTATLDIGTNAGNGTVTFTDLQLNAGGSKQLTASSSGLTSGVSSNFSVSSASFSKLQILVPGETAAPGTPSGKTGTPTPQASGAPFNVTVNAVDANWNLVNTISDTVGITSSDSIATLPPNAALVNGTKSFTVTLNALGSQTLTASDITQPDKTADTSSAINVGAGAPRKLAVQTQPSSSATAGIAFVQNPVLRVEDAGGNLVTTDNGRVITATRNTGSGTLQGTVTATTVNGVATFTNLSYNLAETITLNFTASGLTNVVSANIAVSAANATKVVFVTQPGGQARAGTALGTQPVIKTEDQFGNLSSAGLPANLLVNLALTSGSGSLSGSTVYDIGASAGNGVVSCTNLACSAAGGNKQITASAAGLSNAVSSAFVVGGIITATGGSAISADAAGGAYTTLVGPSYYESLSGDASTGTIILNPPAGFIFDTGGTAPSVIVTRLGGSGANANNINGVASGAAVAISSRATNQITFTVTNASSAGVACSLTWTNLRVRPLTGTPLASGNLTKTGTSTMAAVTDGSTSFGALSEIAGLATRLAFSSQPGMAVAGAPFGNQPVVRTRDQFGNDSVVGLPASKIVSVTLSSGTGPLLGTTSMDIGTSAGNGAATFTNLEIDAALTTKQLTASATGFTNAVSSLFAVGPGAASRLSIQTVPGSGTAGAAFSPQPVIRIEDAFGNLRNLDSGTLITATRNGGSGTLQGTTEVGAVNGIATFANLAHTVAGIVTIDFTSPGLTGATSGNITINPAAASKLTIQTQPSSVATAGSPFAQQPVVRIEDQFGNCRTTDNLVITASSSAGSGMLQGTTSVAAVNGVATFANLSHNVVTNITIQFSSGALTPAVSTAIDVAPGIANRLVFATQPGSASAGSPFAVQPVLKTQDPFGNDSVAGLPATLNVSVALTGGTGPLQGTTTLDIGTAGGNGSVTFSNLQIDNAGTNKQLTASAAGLSNALSTSFPVSAGPAHHLVLQTQPSAAATAGTVFAAQPVIRVEDQFNNPMSTDNSTVVTASLATGSGALQGTLSRTAVNGLITFNNLSYNVAETITLSFGSGTLVDATSSSIVVSAAAANRITIQTQPSATANAGLAFAQQPVLRIEDQFGNLRSTDNSTVVTATRSAGSGALQGTTSATAVGGIVTYNNLAHNLANNITIQFAAAALSNAVSTAIAVSPGAFAKLQLLVPGETAAPATATGKTGTPLSQTVGEVFNVIVNAVDANWNVVENVTDLVRLSSSSLSAQLPADAPLLAGSRQFSMSFSTSGSATVSAADLADNSKPSSTSPAITIIAASYTAATGGSSISADTVGGAFTSLTGPSYSEPASGSVGTGTLILTAPAGFMFDTAGAAPTVLMTRIAGSGSSANNINGATSGTLLPMTSVSSSQLVFTVTKSSASGLRCSLTWTNLRVRPIVGTPLAIGHLRMTGTATVTGVGTNSNFGLLREVPGAARLLGIQTQPSATATAGVVFAQQPAVQVQDQFGNLRTNDNSTTVNAARSAGSGTLQGGTTAVASNGLVQFTSLSHNVATNITITFSATGLSNIVSGSVAVSPAAADRLVFSTQPANGTVGGLLATQPVVRSQDQFGNNSAVGLSASQLVALTLSAGAGQLSGTTTLDIGSAAGNGAVTFTDLMIDMAGADKQLTASAPGLNSALSSVFAVAEGSQTISFGALPGKTYGDAAFAVSATASSGLPVSFSIVSGPATINAGMVTIIGAGDVTVRATQAGNVNWSAAAPMDQSFTVGKAALTITAEDKSRAYGQANPVFTGTITGIQNGDDITADYQSSATANSPAGSYSIEPALVDPADRLANYSVNSSSGVLTVTPAVLTVTADNQSRVYAAPDPEFTATITGFVDGESLTNSGVTGTPEFTTSANAASTVAGGPYTITPTIGTLAAGNYSFTFVNGALTITPAGSTLDLILSANPAIAGSNVTLTATIAAVAPSSAVATGTVQFLVDGVPLGSPVEIVSGSASLDTSSLAVGAHTIGAEYAGNGNVSGSTNSVGLTINNPATSVPPCTLTGISTVTNGLRITISGQPSFSYRVERTTALQTTATVWQHLGLATTDNEGKGEFTDVNPPAGQAFYRTVRP